MLLILASLAGGLVVLIFGGELLVRGAVRLAECMGLSPLLIGIAIVGLGTSAPELAASVQAALAGAPGIAIGNIVGSNLANLLLILGTAALISPMVVPRGPLWRDGGVGLAAAGLLLGAGLVFGLTAAVGAAFLLMLGGYLFYAYREEKAGHPHTAAYDRALAMEEADSAFAPYREEPAKTVFPWRPSLLLVGGIALVVVGGSLLVSGAIGLAERFGVSDAVIGLTIVAIGTSLPELVTSVIAAIRKEADVALGNVLGSNIYNIFFIGGFTGLAASSPVPGEMLRFDLPVLIVASAAVMLFAYTGGRLSRREGLGLLAAYLVYLTVTSGLV